MYIHATLLRGRLSAADPRGVACTEGGRYSRVSSRTRAAFLSCPVSMQNEALDDDVTPGAESGACRDSPSPSEITKQPNLLNLDTTHRGIQWHYTRLTITLLQRRGLNRDL